MLNGKPLGYWLQCPELEALVGCHFELINDDNWGMTKFYLKELNQYIASQIFTCGKLAEFKYCPNAKAIKEILTTLSTADKISLQQAILAHL